MIAAVACLLTSAFAYIASVSFPLRRELKELEGALAESLEMVTRATAELSSLERYKSQIEQERSLWNHAAELSAGMASPYLVDAPLRFTTAFRNQGIEGAEIQLTRMLPFPSHPDHAVACWQVVLPKGRVLPFGEALANIENAFQLGQVRSLAVHRQDPTGASKITLEFDTLVRP